MDPEVQPGGDPAGDPAGDPVAEPAWAPPQEEWQQVVATLGHLAELEQRRSQVYQQPQQPAGYQVDPFADDFADQLRGVIRAELQPFQQFQTDTQLAEAEEYAKDILHDEATKGGEFNIDLARMRADALLPRMQQQYGYTAKAAEEALIQAAKDQREYEQQMYQQSVSKHTNQIATLAGAPGEPGSTYTVGVQQRTMPDYTKGGRVTDRFFGPKAGQ